MRSFTSSFERAPATRSRYHVLIILISALILLGAAETFWRTRGAAPDYVDDSRRWSYFRDQVETMTGSEATILLGKSRIQGAWSLNTFRSMLPERPIIQLAIAGNSAWPILQDLSETTEFSGVIIVDFTASDILSGRHQQATRYVKEFSENWTLNKKINFLISDFFQGLMVTQHPRHSLKTTISQIGNSPEQYTSWTREREVNNNYRIIDIEKKRASDIRWMIADTAKFERPEKAVWTRRITEFEKIIRPLAERGAKLVFIRFPSEGIHWELDEQKFPHRDYWDELARKVPGTWIHFKDIAGIEKFRLPDTTHLDQSDKPAFTKLIIKALQELGIYSRKNHTEGVPN